jgi:oligopeptide transport system substrate-binding protein
MRQYNRVFGLLALLALLVASFGLVSAQEPLTLRVAGGESDVPTLDPALATDSESIQILNETYVGLTHLDEVTQIAMPGMANDWEMTENTDEEGNVLNITYTFNLRNDVPWVRYNAATGQVEQIVDADGNPRMVNAHDFDYGWARTLSPCTAGEYAYVLYPQIVDAEILNGLGLSSGQCDNAAAVIEAISVIDNATAVDDFTFQVVAPAFAPYSVAIYGMWMARPQPQWVIEEFGDLWIEPENFVAYGPFTLKDWAHAESITMIKNPFWPGNEVAPVSTIDEVTIVFLDAATALAEYEAGNLDYVDDVDTSAIQRIKADPVLSLEYVEGTTSSSAYYGFSVGVDPFDNVHCRRAFSYAIDRQDLVDNVLQSGQTPAPYFTTPALGATAPDPTAMADAGYGISFDPELANAELATCLEEKGLADVSGLAPITILFNENATHQRVAERISAQWFEVLGVEVQITAQEFGTYLDQRETFPVWRAGWGSDYPDAHNFLYDVFHSTSQNNDTGWANEEYDALLEEAALLSDPAERQAIYMEAEQILVYEDAAIIPLWWGSDVELTKPNVERTYSVGGDQRFEKWNVTR